MIGHQLTLLRRELWEHPAIYVAPLAIAALVLLGLLTGQVTVSAFGEAVDFGIVIAQNSSDLQRAAAITGVLLIVTTLFALGALIVMAFYSLDALYAERKDKSILFWRSLPITDAETVLSKLLTALLVIPLVTLLIAIATHLAILVMTSVWVMIQGGDASHLVWSSAPLADAWISSLVFAVAMPLWLSPFVGWFLLVSALTKRAPLLMAFMPLLVVPLLEKMSTGTYFFYNAIFVRSFLPPIARFDDISWDKSELPTLPNGDSFSVLEQLDIAGFLTSPSLWAGMIVCALFVTAAIYVRRYRDESY